MNKDKALIIDGNSIMFRAFFATYKQLEFFKKNNISPNNALKTMSQMLFNIVGSNNYTHLAIAFDAQGGSFRDEILEDYKANRKETPPELILQIPPIHEMVQLMGFNFYCIPGIEADDVVGSISKMLSRNKIDCDIFSSDRDMFQLIDDYISVKIPLNGGGIKVFDKNNFKSQYHGLTPNQVCDFKAIAGDKSDNINGVKGIGEKGAINLLLKLESLENIYNNLNLIDSDKTKKCLIESKEIAFISKKMVTILTDYFNDKKPDDFIKKTIDHQNLNNFFKSHNIKSLERYLI